MCSRPAALPGTPSASGRGCLGKAAQLGHGPSGIRRCPVDTNHTMEKRSLTLAAAGEQKVFEKTHLVCCCLCRTARKGLELTWEGRTDLEVRETGCCRGAGVLAGREGRRTRRLNAFSVTQNPSDASQPESITETNVLKGIQPGKPGGTLDS